MGAGFGKILTALDERVLNVMSVRIDKRGTRNHNSKLDIDKVRHILGSSRSNAALARQLGVSPAAVSNVRTGRTWSWIDTDWDRDDADDDGLECEEAA